MSIRVRLTVLYVSLLAAVLFIFGATFFGILNYSLYQQIDQTLQARAEQVVRGIASENRSFAQVLRTGNIRLPDLDLFSPALDASRSILIQVNDAEGAVIDKSRNFGRFTLPPLSDERLDLVEQGQEFFEDQTVEGVRLRVFIKPLPINQQVIGFLQVAQPVATVERVLSWVLLALFGGTILALLITALLGVMVARFSLRPIERITETANQIVSAEDLDQRLPVSKKNDEVDRLSRTINSMLARLDNFFQAQVRLSADVSHELRTPLTIIRGNVDLIRNCDESEQERSETLNAIDSAMDRMARIVSDLLLLSQADAGMSLTMHPLELELLILDVYQQGQALAKGVSLHLGHTEPAAGFGDADRLKQLLINLIDNGIKHTPIGGSVTISLYKEADWIRISVADTGAGISPEALPHIFDRFYRAKGLNRKGSGLGLAIAKWIAEAHAGTLTAESKIGNGSTFVLRLPLKTEKYPLPPESTPIRTVLKM
ncbi:MAG: HAMP domain-containing sensor histidine kinase [Chloroflexota bacterium]